MDKTLTKRKRSRDCERMLVLLDMLRNRHDHPDANACFTDMQHLIPGIGQSTVYRHLAYLVDQGLIAEIKVDSKPTKYDATLDTHGHFQCQLCGQLWDIAPIQVTANYPGAVESAVFIAKGSCNHCLKKN
ncbi:MAG: transcriptional repressor [Patescibacteria group bacterium]|jgi:Fe2+ or Zn2+ uptake regulation protein